MNSIKIQNYDGNSNLHEKDLLYLWNLKKIKIKLIFLKYFFEIVLNSVWLSIFLEFFYKQNFSSKERKMKKVLKGKRITKNLCWVHETVKDNLFFYQKKFWNFREKGNEIIINDWSWNYKIKTNSIFQIKC